jgi:hypothetical protein
MYYEIKLGKAKNGQLYVCETTGYRLAGQDWGETEDDQWHTQTFSFTQATDDFQEAFLEIGKVMLPGEITVTGWERWNDEDFQETLDYYVSRND